MSLHYHGTPITPRSQLLKMSGRNFCVSFVEPRDLGVCLDIGQSVMLDNGAFSAFTRGVKPDWISASGSAISGNRTLRLHKLIGMQRVTIYRSLRRS